MQITRRGFIETTAALGLLGLPRVLLRAAGSVESKEDGDILVVLELSGGNDGLNTVVPYADAVYHRSRPTLALDEESVLRLDGRAGTAVGLHPAMGGFRELYDAGSLAVVLGVGYPNPSRSHFRSMDIWHTARPEAEDVEDGWLGRGLEARRDSLSALYVGDSELPLALAGDVPVPCVQNIDFLDFLSTERGARMRGLLRSLNEPRRSGGAETVRRLATSTLAQLEKMVELRGQTVTVEYPSNDFAQRLKLTGQLIAGGLPNRIYYLRQGGYDTHASQKNLHEQLLGDLASSVRAFFRHLESVSLHRRVVLLVFSEFGRRLEENGSLGTDHGVAAPVFVISGRARGGIHGEYPSLVDLDEGDLRHAIDFRRVYASLLEQALALDSRALLGGDFPALDLLA